MMIVKKSFSVCFYYLIVWQFFFYEKSESVSARFFFVMIMRARLCSAVFGDCVTHVFN